MSQLTIGQGTHSLHLTPANTTNLRATVICSLFNSTFYDCSPAIIFTLLAKPFIEPEFSLNLAAIQLIFRSLKDNYLKQRILELIHDSDVMFSVDGPIQCIHQLYHHEVYHQTLHLFLNNQLDSHKWQHQLREKYRQHMWSKTARERGQHYRGIEQGVNRLLTIQHFFRR